MLNQGLYKRQIDLVSPHDLNFDITILGCGGIGSWTALALAKMGANLMTLVDYDKVEPHNIPSQIYSPDDVGLSKVDALQKIIRTFTPCVPITFSGKAEEFAGSGLPFGRVIIGAVDSLDARKSIWEIVRPLMGQVALYIDCRMGGEMLRLISVSPFSADSVFKYQKRMDGKAAPDDTPCTARSVVYNTFTVGGFVASLVKRYSKREPIEYEVNFDLQRLERV